MAFAGRSDFPGDITQARQLLEQAPEPTDGMWRVLQANSINTLDWLGVAEGWVQAFNAEINDFQRKGDPRQGVPLLKSDSYFNGTVDKLYPEEKIHHG